MAAIGRRQALQLIGTASLAAGFVWTTEEALDAQQRTQQARRRAPAFTPAFFTAHEYATVTMLADMIIPRDDRSGSASEAGVPQFMDFMMVDQPARQVPMRGGLAWLDLESQSRFNTTFRSAAEKDRGLILDDLSGLEPPAPELSHGIAFFRSFRDLAATGFWTSRAGIADLQFQGNVFVPEWKGCPEDALKKLGL
jgi:hypothetical protein